MEPVRKRILDAVMGIVAIDAHTHLNPLRPAASTLDDLLSYHYWTELSHSAGMPAALVAKDVAPAKRIRNIAKFLPRLSNTVQYGWLIDIARDLLGFDDDFVDERNIDALAKLAAQKMRRPGWDRTVLAKSRIDVAFLTNDFDDKLAGFDTHLYVPCLRCDELVLRLGQPGVLDRLRACSRVDVKNGATLEKALAAVFAHFKRHNARACAIGLTPDFAPQKVSRASVEPLLARTFAGQPLTHDECRRVQHYIFWTITQLCSDHGLPFDLMIGAIRGVYPAGVTGGQDLFDRRNSLSQYDALFNAFANVKFPVSIIDSGENPELITYSWIRPNVYPAGHWWYSNIPSLIERDLRGRLQAVPRVKQLGYYSDMYMLELGYPKFNMYRRCLARVLVDEFICDRGWSEEKAVDLAADLLRRNVQRIFYNAQM
ncbi:MAG: glucuronate isomerase [Phycisphaerae bacterium]|nr:glucuronate isomerase [Phycisphaerae bacterium]